MSIGHVLTSPGTRGVWCRNLCVSQCEDINEDTTGYAPAFFWCMDAPKDHWNPFIYSWVKGNAARVKCHAETDNALTLLKHCSTTRSIRISTC